MSRVLFLVGMLLATRCFAIQPGDKAPQFALKGSKERVSLSALTGKVVYVDFWASWCSPCRQSFPWMSEIQKRYGPNGFKVVAINLDQASADAEAFLAKTPAEFTTVFDPQGDVPTLYGVETMPSSFLLDRSGKVVATHKGFSESDKEGLEKQIEALLK